MWALSYVFFFFKYMNISANTLRSLHITYRAKNHLDGRGVTRYSAVNWHLPFCRLVCQHITLLYMRRVLKNSILLSVCVYVCVRERYLITLINFSMFIFGVCVCACVCVCVCVCVRECVCVCVLGHFLEIITTLEELNREVNFNQIYRAIIIQRLSMENANESC